MSYKIILNFTNKPIKNTIISTKFLIHFRAKTNEDYKKFLDICKNKLKIDISNIKAKIEMPLDDNFKDLDLPEFSYISNSDWQHLYIYCMDFKDRQILGEALDIKISENEKSIWYPERPELGNPINFWQSSIRKTKYPLYIISKGRYEEKLRYTQKNIKLMTDDYYLVVEEDEFELYKKNGVPENNLLMFSNKEHEKYKSGDYKGSDGSIPVRNFIWQHSKSKGFKRHWCIDDNIDGFYRFLNNARVKIKCVGGFRAIEYFADKYNIPMAGMNYCSFVPEISKRRQMIQKNTRIYSIILLDNNANKMMNKEYNNKPYLWRGKYNEDTDLSLRLLKSGKPTALFNSFLANKKTTMTVKGGNTSGIYQNDGLQKKLDSLIKQHPDVVKGTIKFKKVHHEVNYKPYKDNQFIICNNNQKKINWDFKLLTDSTMKAKINRQKKFEKIKEPKEKPKKEPKEEPKEEPKKENKLNDIMKYIENKKLTEEEKKKLICCIAMM